MKFKKRLLIICLWCITAIFMFMQLYGWRLLHRKYAFWGTSHSTLIQTVAEISQISLTLTSTLLTPKIAKVERIDGNDTLNSSGQNIHKVFNENSTLKSLTSHLHKASEPRQVEPPNRSKLILIYTPLFGKLPWPGLSEADYNFTNWNHKACHATNCKLTYNKTLIPSADVVLFHGRDMPSVKEMKRISIRRPAIQRWVYFIHESPIYTPYDPGIYNGFFNWTMTYRRDSDIFLPYRHYAPLSATDKKPERKNHASGKDKLVAWMVGHCGIIRDQYAQILSQYLKLDVYGKCSHNFDQFKDCSQGSPDCSARLKRYKFYLSFENSYCVDYITEKYWYTPFHHDMVPVVFGGSDYGPEVAIPGSYINVLDFPTIESLANYLLYLHENDTAYNEYFSWKGQYKPVEPKSWTCQMCSMLNKKLGHKTWDLRKFWGINETCRHYEDKINNLIGDYGDQFSNITNESLNATQTFLNDQLTPLE